MRWLNGPETGEAVVVNVSDRDSLLADLEDRLVAGRGFCVATLNLDHVTKLRRLPSFRRAYARQTHVTADGNPIVWFSHLAGERVSLVPGSELILPLIERAVAHDIGIAFFGSTPDSLAETRAVLQARYPTLRVVAEISPPMGFDPEGAQADSYISDLGASGAGMCFVALGAPKQEIFAARALDVLPGMGFLSIGAGLDFISGRQVRAPRIVRRLAAEWLWRLALSPRRLASRYAACFAVMPSLFVLAMQARRDVRRGAAR